jgi:hypothetical protein
MSELGAQRMLTPSGITRVVVRLEDQVSFAENRTQQTGAPPSPCCPGQASKRCGAHKSSITLRYASSTSIASQARSSSASPGSSRKRYRASSVLPLGPPTTSS